MPRNQLLAVPSYITSLEELKAPGAHECTMRTCEEYQASDGSGDLASKLRCPEHSKAPPS